MNKIYLDNAATTPLSSEVLAEMMPVLTTDFGNPNSLHSFGREAKQYVDIARGRVANALGCEENEVYFTSGATESNNWAITGLAKAYRHKGNHIITSKIEHASILETCKKLEREGYRVT
ncbi:MAG: aminotransferase class V-fold PLP-dependent enzyme, partial [Clostridia bacterium]|nr:aminotransferase class V-fold PLP-dependent enzyme [Clostridia bacterium]